MLRSLLLGLALTTLPAATVLQPAPDFTLIANNGTSVRLSDYKGKIVLLDFWATRCGGCKVEIPWYTEFQSKYKDKGLALIGVAMDDDGWTKVRPFAQAKKMNYPVVLGDEPLAKQYGVTALPVTLLIDGEGKIAASHTGLVDKNAFEKKIQSLLARN